MMDMHTVLDADTMNPQNEPSRTIFSPLNWYLAKAMNEFFIRKESQMSLTDGLKSMESQMERYELSASGTVQLQTTLPSEWSVQKTQNARFSLNGTLDQILTRLDMSLVGQNLSSFSIKLTSERELANAKELNRNNYGNRIEPVPLLYLSKISFPPSKSAEFVQALRSLVQQLA